MENTDVIKDKNQHMGKSSHVNVIKNNGTINYNNNSNENKSDNKEIIDFFKSVFEYVKKQEDQYNHIRGTGKKNR